MNWKIKAVAQRVLAALPPRFGSSLYYALQKTFGTVCSRGIDAFLDGKRIIDCIYRQGQSLDNKTCLEVGTGVSLQVPIALWLCGASQVTTVDVTHLLAEELVLADLDVIRNEQVAILDQFHEYRTIPGFTDRFHQLLEAEPSLDRLLNMIHTRYIAPANAACLDVPSETIDYHLSRVVFEHVPPEGIKAILREGKRVLKKGGLGIHGIDFSDHFSHFDRSISSINFLQFNDRQWARFSRGRFSYHNRLRVDDIAATLVECGMEIVSTNVDVDQDALRQLRGGFKVDGAFQCYSHEALATKVAWIVAKAV